MSDACRSLRVAVADNDPEVCQLYADWLPRLGHQVVVVADSVHELTGQCLLARPELIIASAWLPDGRGSAAAQEINRDRLTPVILALECGQTEPPVRTGTDPALAYLLKPIVKNDLEPAIALALRRFKEFESFHQETTALIRAERDRKTVQRAKSLLMKREDLDGLQAIRRMRQLAQDNAQNLADIARMVLVTTAALERLEQVPSYS